HAGRDAFPRTLRRHVGVGRAARRRRYRRARRRRAGTRHRVRARRALPCRRRRRPRAAALVRGPRAGRDPRGGRRARGSGATTGNAPAPDRGAPGGGEKSAMSERRDGLFWLLIVMAAIGAANAVWMLADPLSWYNDLPAGVPAPGPFH